MHQCTHNFNRVLLRPSDVWLCSGWKQQVVPLDNTSRSFLHVHTLVCAFVGMCFYVCVCVCVCVCTCVCVTWALRVLHSRWLRCRWGVCVGRGVWHAAWRVQCVCL